MHDILTVGSSVYNKTTLLHLVPDQVQGLVDISDNRVAFIKQGTGSITAADDLSEGLCCSFEGSCRLYSSEVAKVDTGGKDFSFEIKYLPSLITGARHVFAVSGGNVNGWSYSCSRSDGGGRAAFWYKTPLTNTFHRSPVEKIADWTTTRIEYKSGVSTYMDILSGISSQISIPGTVPRGVGLSVGSHIDGAGVQQFTGLIKYIKVELI